MNGKSYYIKNFGCKINQYEGELLSYALEASGYKRTSLPEEADILIVNTCVVTHKAERDARRAINRMIRVRKDGAKILVVGCLPEYKQVDSVDFVGGFRQALRYLGLNVPNLTPYQHRARPFVRIQTGCNFRCSYCIVPFVRGRSRSRPLNEIIDEIRALVEKGYEELVLTGTQIGNWGMEWGLELSDLIEKILEIKGFRIRLSSISPIHVTERLIGLMASNRDRIAPHLHISLQSGSDRILRAMRRPYTAKTYRKKIEQLLEALPDIAIGTDVIAGFPTESDEEFQETLHFIEEIPFAYLHVFEFSPRPGTDAAEMRPQVPPHIRKARVRELLKVAQEKRVRYASRFIGRVLHVVVEKKVEDGIFTGTSEFYIKLRFHLDEDVKFGKILPVRLLEVDRTVNIGKVLTSESAGIQKTSQKLLAN